MPLSSQKKIVDLCRELRKNSTQAERLMWKNLRNRRISGKKFSRQFPIVYSSINGLHYFFVADFYCHEKKLVIEVDGIVHDFQEDYDRGRTYIINEMGIRVLRFSNQEVSENMSSVLKEIRNALE
ncbi:MAG: endonuclease domain-containing protein [Flavobacteriales bacterium]|nr:endonuclease domain-containing protein [Flavobacteriales bacterium]MCB9191082.1 endonuclease domain-containing protein [Flavobacteriales bacterium]MCB9203429.1 endonuclease domain-containing protein [Flavobacteriales bacterium]